MEDDPDRWYKMVLEDEEAMEQEQRARAKEQIVKGFGYMTYEMAMKYDEEELANDAYWSDDYSGFSQKKYDAYKWIVYGIKPYYMEPEYIHKMELKDRQYKRAAKNLSKKNVKRVRRFTTHKSNTTYSGLVPLRTWLEHREGEQGKLKLGKRGMDEVERNFRNRHRDVLDTANVAGMEVSQLTEGQLRKIVAQNECGPKIVQIENQGKIELYVTLLSLGPNTAMKTIPVPVDDHPPQESDTPTFSGRENEAVIGGSFGQDAKVVITRINRKTPDQRSVGKSKRDRLRKARKPERDSKEKEQRENRSAKKRLRRQQQLSEDSEAREFKRKKTVDNGGEKVTPEVRRLLGKSHKPKIVNKRKVKDIETSKEIAELTRRKHKEQESSKWKTGMRVAAHEDRQQRRKKISQVTTDCVRPNFDIESQNLPCSQATFPDGSEVGPDSPPSSPPQSTANSTQATFPESYGSKFTDNHNIPSSSSPQSTTASVVSSQATFSDLYRSTFPDNNQILPSTSPPQSTTTTVVSSQATFPETPHITFTDSIYRLSQKKRTFRIVWDMCGDQIFWLFWLF